MVGNQSQLMLNPRPASYLSLLDENTIGKICKHLSILDLLQFGELDINYQRIIGQQIISKQTLNISTISKHYDVRQAFKQFGEFAKQLHIKESDIQYKKDKYTHAEEIFRLIKKRCVADQLKSVTIGFDGDLKQVDANRFLDVFAELKSLTIEKSRCPYSFGLKRDEPLKKLLEKLLANCTKLTTLKLNWMRCDIDFLMIPQMRTLQSLWLHETNIPYDNWMKFIKSGVCPLTSLKIDRSSFLVNEYVKALDQGEFLRDIVEAFPQLETFILFYCGHLLDKLINPNCDALKTLHHLKEFRILELKYSNLIQSLAGPCSIQKLSFKLTGIESVESIPLSIMNLTNLRSIEFYEPDIIHMEIYKSFLNLPQLSQCVFSAGNKYYNPYDMNGVDLILLEIIKSSEHLQVLKVTISHLILSSNFYKDIVKMRHTRFPNAAPLHLCAKFKRMKRTSPHIIQICNTCTRNCQFFA